jgi:hypothetical protein
MISQHIHSGDQILQGLLLDHVFFSDEDANSKDPDMAAQTCRACSVIWIDTGCTGDTSFIT